MLPASLENYLIVCRNQNIPFAEISKKLVSVGWGQNDILEAEYWYKGKLPKPQIAAQSIPGDAKVFTIPANLSKYPHNRIHPFFVLVIFLGLTIVTFLVLQTF